VIEIEITKLGT